VRRRQPLRSDSSRHQAHEGAASTGNGALSFAPSNTTNNVITSHQNPLLKDIRRVGARKERGRFVAEGEDLLAAADGAGWQPLHLLRAGVEVSEEALARVSALGSGTRALAVYEERWADKPAGPLVLALWGVKDPGNVGTVLRAAHAFGASCVALGPETADPYGPKAVRASMGAIFVVPVARVSDVSELPGTTIALDARRGEPLRGPAQGDVSIVVGAERAGLPDAVVGACDRAAHIPIRNESLNAAMAATLAAYELSRVSNPEAPC
jgi:TrmH family RNA methyltransferase